MRTVGIQANAQLHRPLTQHTVVAHRQCLLSLLTREAADVLWTG